MNITVWKSIVGFGIISVILFPPSSFALNLYEHLWVVGAAKDESEFERNLHILNSSGVKLRSLPGPSGFVDSYVSVSNPGSEIWWVPDDDSIARTSIIGTNRIFGIVNRGLAIFIDQTISRATTIYTTSEAGIVRTQLGLKVSDPSNPGNFIWDEDLYREKFALHYHFLCAPSAVAVDKLKRIYVGGVSCGSQTRDLYRYTESTNQLLIYTVSSPVSIIDTTGNGAYVMLQNNQVLFVDPEFNVTPLDLSFLETTVNTSRFIATDAQENLVIASGDSSLNNYKIWIYSPMDGRARLFTQETFSSIIRIAVSHGQRLSDISSDSSAESA